MHLRRLISLIAAGVCITGHPGTAWGQVLESVGTRALGMGGAFVAVASDSSAVWWNPAGLATGPFFDVGLTHARAEIDESLPAWRNRMSGFSAAVPPFGVSYYRFRITQIQPFNPTTAQVPASREDRRIVVPVRSLEASQFGVTVVQTLFSGIHAGATVKYVRGALHLGREDGAAIPGDLLDRGDDLASTDAAGDVGVDAGVLAVVGPVRLGARIGNLLRPQIGNVMLPRQARIGVAFDPEPVTGVPLTIALDADIRELPAVTGPRQMVAVGGEYWLFEKRLGVRGGGRVNRIGLRERIGTAGASVAVRPGMFVDAHLSHGSRAESGWSVAARVSF